MLDVVSATALQQPSRTDKGRRLKGRDLAKGGPKYFNRKHPERGETEGTLSLQTDQAPSELEFLLSLEVLFSGRGNMFVQTIAITVCKFNLENLNV